MSYVLVTGGAGYIGSHTVVELLELGYNVVVLDNLSNSSYDSIARIELLTKKKVPFFEVDLVNYDDVVKVFEKYPITSVIHFAGLKAVGESTQVPLKYYRNNILGSINLLNAMEAFGVKSLVFSSSLTVYGEVSPEYIPIPEHCPLGPTNPYGKTKLTIEDMIRDTHTAQPDTKFAILRYFNPIGAHESGLIGEDPLGIPNNLLPFLLQVAVGRQPELRIFGSDYDTKDGTPIRDYIHVKDLLKGHLSLLQYLKGVDGGICREWNLGTGTGSTVFDIFHAFTKVIGKDLPHKVVGRRAGDVLNLTANPSRANKELKWATELDVNKACEDLWAWTTKNPYGYQVKNYTWEYFNDQHDYSSRLHKFVSFNGKFEVGLANYGATIVYCKLEGVQLNTGFSTEKSYKRADNPYFGATIGRVANRIKNGKCTINGETFNMPLNERNENSLHGGFEGFDKQLWRGPSIKQDSEKKETVVEFMLIDKDGTLGYPGDLQTVVKYIIRDVGETGGELVVEYDAKLLDYSKRESTAVSLTNHQYWNISGGGSIDKTELKLNTDKYLTVGDDLIPTGEFTKIDSKEVTLGAKEPFFDYCFVVGPQDKIDTRSNKPQLLLEAKHPDTKIKFTALSTEPSFQLYTGDYVDVEGAYKSRCGFCVEAARYIYHPKWFIPLNKGETYGSSTTYRFEKF